MTETPPALPPEPPAPKAPSMSLMARLLNVFATPGEVFDDVKTAAPRTANWLVPVLITCIVSSIGAVILFSQPAIQQKIREGQEQAMEKKVQAGQMTRQQADQAMVMIEKFSGPTMMKIFGVIGSVVYGFGRLFWWATVLWLLGRWFLKARFSYVKTMEMAGLAGMIGVLGALVTFLLQLNMSNPMASPSLALLVKDFNPAKISHVLLATFNAFEFWQAFVLAAALARLASVPFLRSAFVVFGFWIFWTAVRIAFGAATVGLAG